MHYRELPSVVPSRLSRPLRFAALMGLSVITACAESTAAQRPAEDANYVTEVPNVNWDGLDPSERERATRIMNAHSCPCGCGMTVAECRRDDPNCPRSPVLASAIIAAIGAGKSDAEVVQSLAPAPVEAPDDGTITRVRFELPEMPGLGPRDAPVTLVEFIDYQCPFCARADETIEKLREKYGDKLRWVLVQNPLDFHPEAPLAAEAVLAAAEHDQFHPMHELLLEKQDRLARTDLVAYADQLGIPGDDFEAALDSGRYRARVKADRALAERIGVNSTPYFFVNGRPLRGAQPPSAFEQLIEEELSSDLRASRWVDRVPSRPVRPPVPSARVSPFEDPDKIYELDITGSMARGPEEAPITLVEFTDFQCSYCARIQETLDELEAAYPGKIRWVAMNRPLTRIHREALPSALAALAAGRQGKYWEYRDLLFANQQALSDKDLRRYAEQVGLDLSRFERDRSAPELLELIEREVAQANEADVRGTPTVFINGKKFAGLKSVSVFKAAVEDLLATRAESGQ